MEQLSGIFPALITPFDEDDGINAKALEQIVKQNLQQGVSGFYVGGSTAESLLLTAEERKYLLEIVLDTVKGQAKVIVNVGAISTAQAVSLAIHAQDTGADFISSIPPIYYQYNSREYEQYFLDILRSTSLPLFVYNVPALSGVSLSDEDFSRLFQHDRIAGVKFTSYDLFLMQRLIQRHPTKTVIIGHDEIYLSALAAGARALIGSTVGLLAEEFLQIERAFLNQNLEVAQEIQFRVNAFITVLLKIGIFKAIKAAFAIRGIPCGQCRKPFQSLTGEDLEILAAALRCMDSRSPNG